MISNRKKLEEAPLGLYAVTPPLDEIRDATYFDELARDREARRDILFAPQPAAGENYQT